MFKFFIDCGAHKGESVSRFKQDKSLYSPDFVIHSFEPNPKYYMESERLVWHKKAVWTEDGHLDFYLDEKDGDGSSLLREKNTPGDPNNLDEPIRVECIDFGKWILKNFWKEDYLILKMDIEGAEYKVLEKMIDDGSLQYIDKIFIEWHWHKIGMSERDHNVTVSKVKEACEQVNIEYKLI